MDIETYFLSDSFLEISKDLITTTNEPLATISILVHIGTIYYQLFSDEKFFSNENITKFILDTTVEYNNRFGIKPYNTTEIGYENFIKEKIFNEIIDKVQNREDLIAFISKNVSKKFIFHSFKSSCLDSIKKFGINPNINFTPQEELNNIDTIFKNHGVRNILGFQKVNCENRISYSESSAVSYSYGVRAPEWFSQFTGHSYSYIIDCFNDNDMDAYIYNNNELARSNLLKIMNKHDFNESEINYVLNFFEQNWNIYANEIPILAMITQVDNINTSFLSSQSNNSLMKALKFMLDKLISDIDLDVQSYERIDTSNAKFISLPNINMVLNYQKQNIQKKI